MGYWERGRKEKGQTDLEAIEMQIRKSMHQVGAKLLEKLLWEEGTGYRGSKLECNGFHTYRYVEDREKELVTVLGTIRVKRAYYYDAVCKQGKYPRDAELDIEGSDYSPGVRRMMARMGANRSFALGEEDLMELAGISVDAKSIERWSEKLGEEVEACNAHAFSEEKIFPVIPLKKIPILYVCADGTGVPVVRGETKGRKGKAEDGMARTREAKLGCVFTQTTLDQEGRPLRDENSTSYTGAIETADEFSCRLEAEAVRRGIKHAQRVCMIGDGAAWIWRIASERFPRAIQIIDLYHAREHYWKVAHEAFSHHPKRKQEWTDLRKEELEKGRPDQVAKAIRKLIPKGKEKKHPYATEANYFESNASRMKYDQFRAQGLFVGSGVLEAGCRAVIGQRLKQSGMHWTVKGANAIIALRACFASNRWEDFWESRCAA